MNDGTDDLSQQLWESESYYDDVERRQAAQKACLFGPAPTTAGACCVLRVCGGGCRGTQPRCTQPYTIRMRAQSIPEGPAPSAV